VDIEKEASKTQNGLMFNACLKRWMFAASTEEYIQPLVPTQYWSKINTTISAKEETAS
jgi:hypothetical protein